MNPKNIQSKKGLSLLSLILTSVLLTACGGGGGGGGADAVPPPASPPPVGPTVTGSVTKGPVNAATVQFFNLDSRGNAIGNALASATTDANGAFSVTLPAGTGTVLVASSGGSFVDESDQEPNVSLKRQIQLTSGQGFTSLLPSGATIVAINPYTHALVVRARLLSETAGGFLGLFDRAKAILDTQAGFDVLTTIPANPTAPEVSASLAQKQYALLLGGLANAINNVSIQLGQQAPSYDVIIAVTGDFVDGTLDGRIFGEPISIAQSDANASGALLPTNIILNTEITRFRNNNFANYSGVALPSIETTLLSNIDAPTLLGALPNPFFFAGNNETGDGIGEDFDGGAKFTLNDDGTASILIEEGTLTASYIVTEDVITINLPEGFIQDDFDEFIDIDGDGNVEQFLAEEFLVSLELALIDDLIDFDILSVRAVGFTRFTGVGTTLTKADEAFNDIEEATAFDYARQIPFNITDGYQRTLSFNSSPQFPGLFDDDELYLEEFAFNVDGTGLTLNNNIAFTWVVNADGHLSVIFSNGETADYYHLGTKPSGDIVTVEYRTNVPLDSEFGDLLVGEARLSFLRDNSDSLPNVLQDAAGIYSGLTDIGDDDALGTIALRLNPNGTGILEFDFDDQNKVLVFNSQLGICWAVNPDKTLQIDRVFGQQDLLFPGSRSPTPEFCSNLSLNPSPDQGVFFSYTLNQYDLQGAQYKSFRKQSTLFCDSTSDPNCTPILTVSGFIAEVFNKEVLNAVPPLLLNDSVVVAPGGSAVVNVLANDLVRELAINPASVIIERGPFDGSVSVNSTTGEITYTANESTEGDIVQYRVRDTSGNLSTVATLDITINPPPQIPSDQVAQVRSQVTLSPTVDASSAVSFEWEQISGTVVNLSNPGSANPTFFAPASDSLLQRSVLTFQLTTLDAQGVASVSTNTTIVLAPIPQNAFTYHLYSPPFQFGSEAAGGEIVFFSVDGTGAFQDENGIFTFNWIEENGLLTLDFIGSGDVPTTAVNFFRDTDGDGFQEEIINTSTITSFEYRLSDSPDDPNLLSRRQIGRNVEVNSTLNIQTRDDAIDFIFGQTLVGIDQNLSFDIQDGQTLSLPTNISALFPQLRSGDTPVSDELTFNTNGTGTSKRKNTTFTWEADVNKRLSVSFADGEFALYSLLDRRSNGDVVGIEYVYGDTSIKTTVTTVLTQNPAINWVSGDVAGIYKTIGNFVLNDGRSVPESLFYRMHPDGRGVLELENIDPETGEILGVFTSSFGICWNLNAEGNFVWSRSQTRDQLIPGTSIPNTSHCSALTNELIFFRRENVLFDTNEEGQLLTIAQSEENSCLFSGDPNCDASILNVSSFFHRVLDRTPLTNNPPLLAPDSASVNTEESVLIDVLSNDIVGDVAIDTGTLDIIANPRLGTLSIDVNSGIVTYTAGSVAGSDSFQYRVQDVSGNLSTHGQVDININ